MDSSHLTFYPFFGLTIHFLQAKNVFTFSFIRDCPHFLYDFRLSFYIYNGLLGQVNMKAVHDNQVTNTTPTSLIAY